MSTNSN